MSRSGNLKVSTGGYGATPPSLQGLAIITENESMLSPDNIPNIAIDESFLSADNQKPAAKKRPGPTVELNHVQKPVQIPPESLCGARIAIYRHTSTGRSKRRSIATIGGVFRIGQRYFALTAAHVFFDTAGNNDSRDDGGLYVTSDNAHGIQRELAPRISEVYEVVIESYWPNAADPEIHAKPTNISIGLVAPSVLHRRKSPEEMSLAELIWDDELDWALIELTEPAFWQANRLQLSADISLELRPPPYHQASCVGDVMVASGVSGIVMGISSDSTKTIKLPWSKTEVQAWPVESEMAFGDYGSMAICPKTGTFYGMVASYDSENSTMHLIPAASIFESILSRYSEEVVTIENMFDLGNRSGTSSTLTENDATEEYSRAPVVRSAETDVVNIFKSTLKTFIMQSVDGRRFIRRSALGQWLLTPRRDGIPHIDFMLDHAYPRNAMLPVTSEQIAHRAEPCLVVFSLLFELGRAELTHHFMRQGLTDSRLPFDASLLNDAVDRMGLSDDDAIAQEVYAAQWAYCPMNFTFEMERDIPAHIVVPIHQRQQINSKGGTATLWQITVLEEFVGKRLQAVSTRARFNDPADKLGYRYHFALKTFNKHQSLFFDTEVTALKAFSTIPSMVGYLGNYNHTETRPKRRAPSFSVSEDRKQDQGPTETNNILLEYGQYDLDEFFAANQPPVLPAQLTQFWEDIAGVADAISEIHRFSTRRGGVKQDYSGWHADIKPDNILSVNGTFKLADPGFARFERSDRKLTRLVGGTKTFGSPEAHTSHRLQDSPVSQAIDIWSLGCVLSVAATWVVLGWRGITQYQQLRVEAIKRLRGRSHSRSRTRSRSRSTGRAPPTLSVNTGKRYNIPEGDCFHDGEKVLEEVRHWHAFLRSVTRKSDEISAQILDLVDEKMLTTNPEKRIEAAELYRQMRVIVHAGEQSQVDPTMDIVSQIMNKTDKTGAVDAPRLSAMTLSSAPSDLTPISPNFKASNRSLHPPSPQPHLASKPNLASSPTISEASSENAVPMAKPMPFRSIALNEMGNRSVSSSIDIPVDRPRPDSTVGSGLKAARRMSVSQARAEVDKKKKVFSRKKKDPFLTKHLENRDIEFLIDNGDTMTKYWPEVKDLIEILSSLVSDIDKDGFDLSFTTGNIKLKQKSNTKAVKTTMDSDKARPDPEVRTNMADALDKTFSSYFARLKHKRSSAKNYTLIVATDGVWRGTSEPHAVEDTIVRWMNEIARLEGVNGNKRRSRGVTIQFIQFGRDEEARSRLEMLDRGLIDYEIPDIIDTEPSDGNVLKMLLGSVNASFDYADSGV